MQIFFNDKSKGSIWVHEAKLVVVGNGSVGKTCLVNWLLDNTFNQEEPSTHSVKGWELSSLARKMALQKVKVDIWDFGGQYIYHTTHRLFIHTKALFILVRDIQTQANPEQTEVLNSVLTITYQNRSL